MHDDLPPFILVLGWVYRVCFDTRCTAQCLSDRLEHLFCACFPNDALRAHAQKWKRHAFVMHNGVRG